MREVTTYEVIAQLTSSVVNSFNKIILSPVFLLYESRLGESVAGGEITNYVEHVT